ncbi:hypothetical protein CYY_001525 [Polysphondylium violaceum]|uniref:Uncharacterized protein n=1 Tax=Polysphondylium violaceum TaxID=133409 RepID=A0A8J4Q1Q2_9MYCE|nr:hypothetical protein CYY_001525 [Polysphondylium violaceum]
MKPIILLLLVTLSFSLVFCGEYSYVVEPSDYNQPRSQCEVSTQYNNQVVCPTMVSAVAYFNSNTLGMIPKDLDLILLLVDGSYMESSFGVQGLPLPQINSFTMQPLNGTNGKVVVTGKLNVLFKIPVNSSNLISFKVKSIQFKDITPKSLDFKLYNLISSNGILTHVFDNCLFENIDANSPSDSGMIFIQSNERHGTLTIQNSKFINFTGNPIHVQRFYISLNSVVFSNVSAPIRSYDSRFSTSNVYMNTSAGIEIWDSNATIYKSVFEKNKEHILFSINETQYNVNTLVWNSTFKENNSPTVGGAISFTTSDDKYNKFMLFRVLNSTFIENSATNVNNNGTGGAIFFSSSSGVVDFCEFQGNYADTLGGTIMLNNTNVNITSSIFINNQPNSQSKYMAAIYADKGTILSVENGSIQVFDSTPGAGLNCSLLSSVEMTNTKVLLPFENPNNNCYWVVNQTGCILQSNLAEMCSHIPEQSSSNSESSISSSDNSQSTTTTSTTTSSTTSTGPTTSTETSTTTSSITPEPEPSSSQSINRNTMSLLLTIVSSLSFTFYFVL